MQEFDLIVIGGGPGGYLCCLLYTSAMTLDAFTAVLKDVVDNKLKK